MPLPRTLVSSQLSAWKSEVPSSNRIPPVVLLRPAAFLDPLSSMRARSTRTCFDPLTRIANPATRRKLTPEIVKLAAPSIRMPLFAVNWRKGVAEPGNPARCSIASRLPSMAKSRKRMRRPDFEVKMPRPRKSSAARRMDPGPLISTSRAPSGKANSEWISMTPAGRRTEPACSARRMAASFEATELHPASSSRERAANLIPRLQSQPAKTCATPAAARLCVRRP